MFKYNISFTGMLSVHFQMKFNVAYMFFFTCVNVYTCMWVILQSRCYMYSAQTPKLIYKNSQEFFIPVVNCTDLGLEAYINYQNISFIHLLHFYIIL